MPSALSTSCSSVPLRLYSLVSCLSSIWDGHPSCLTRTLHAPKFPNSFDMTLEFEWSVGVIRHKIATVTRSVRFCAATRSTNRSLVSHATELIFNELFS